MMITIGRDNDKWSDNLSDSLVRIVNQCGVYRRRSGNTRLIVDGRELFLTVSSVKARGP